MTKLWHVCWLGIASLAAGLAATSAQAQEWHRRQASPDGLERTMQPPPLRETGVPRRELLRQDLESAAPMNREERRQLRRDIGDAGREIYPRHPSHGQSR